jgi:hypothetical protein
MTANAPGPWFEVQGQSEDGSWHGIYHYDEKGAARKALGMVLDSKDPMYERYEDFRLAVPTEKALKKKAKQTEVWVA